MIVAPLAAHGAEWRMTPRVSGEQTVSDNITLGSGKRKKQEFVTQVSPGVSITGRGSRLRLHFDYQATGVHYLSGTSASRFDHRLQSKGEAELYEDHLFLDFSSTVSQQNTSSEGLLSSDTISVNDNREMVTVVQASPYWVQRFGRYADATLRYRGGLVGTETVADTALNEFSLFVQSGSAFPQFPWTLTASMRDEDNSVGGGSTSSNSFKQFALAVRHQFTRRYGLRVRAGYEEDDVVGAGKQDGFAGGVTALWTPTPRTEFEAGVQRQTFGNSVLMHAKHRMRRAIFAFDYNESRTTSAQRQFQRQLFSLTDPFGIPLDNPGLQDVGVPTDEPSLGAESFVSRRFSGSVALRGRRSLNTLRLNHERRTYDQSGDEETVMGVTLSTSRELSYDTTLRASVNWQLSEFENREDTRYSLDVAYQRELATNLSAGLSYRFLTNFSDSAANEFTENRVSATVTMLF